MYKKMLNYNNVMSMILNFRSELLITFPIDWGLGNNLVIRLEYSLDIKKNY